MSKKINIVLYQPEIPQNTGNIARTCAATGAVLHLIKPLGFEISDKYLKRAGLDYWNMLSLIVYENAEEFFKKHAGKNMYFLSTKAKRNYCDVSYSDEDFLIFGPESRGLPEDLLDHAYANAIRIPMKAEARSLNLSNSVAIVAYEAYRQLNFDGLCQNGELSHRQEDDHPWIDYI